MPSFPPPPLPSLSFRFFAGSCGLSCPSIEFSCVRFFCFFFPLIFLRFARGGGSVFLVAF